MIIPLINHSDDQENYCQGITKARVVNNWKAFQTQSTKLKPVFIYFFNYFKQKNRKQKLDYVKQSCSFLAQVYATAIVQTQKKRYKETFGTRVE